MNEDGGQHWHLDKRVPIALILALAAQLGTGIFMFGQMFQRLEDLESRLIAAEIDVAAAQLAERKLGNRLTRMETILERIDKRLDREMDGDRDYR